MNKQYYFLVSALPRLFLDVTPEFSYEQIRMLIRLNASEEDWDQAKLFMRYIDLMNLRPYWLEKPIDPRGMLKEKEIEEALLVESVFPDYLFSFLKKGDVEYRLKHFPYLVSRYFQKEERRKGFVGELFGFERSVRLILSTLRALQTDKDLSFELQHEDQKDFFIQELLEQKDVDSFIPPYPFGSLKTIYQKYLSQPKTLFRKLLEFRFEKIEEMMEKQSFSIDYLIGYLYLLMLVDEWQRLDDEKGKHIVDALL